MQFFYKVSANLTSRALKRTEKTVQKIFEKQFKWAFDYLNQHWFISWADFLKAFKTKYKTKNIMKDSYLYNQLKSQYIGFKNYINFDNDKSYETYLLNVKKVADMVTRGEI